MSGKRTGLNLLPGKLEHGLHSATTAMVGGLKTVRNAVKSGVKQSVSAISSLGHGSGGGSSGGGGVGVGVADPSSSGASVADKLASSSRRFTQVAMQKLGRTAASQDEEYEHLKEFLKAMRAEFQTLTIHLQAFIGCVRSTGRCARAPHARRGSPLDPHACLSPVLICVVADGWGGGVATGAHAGRACVLRPRGCSRFPLRKQLGSSCSPAPLRPTPTHRLTPSPPTPTHRLTPSPPTPTHRLTPSPPTPAHEPPPFPLCTTLSFVAPCCLGVCVSPLARPSALSLSCHDVGTDFRVLFTGAEAPVATSVNGFARVSSAIENDVRRSMVRRCVALLFRIRVPVWGSRGVDPFS
jgi:hypothetical protein